MEMTRFVISTELGQFCVVLNGENTLYVHNTDSVTVNGVKFSGVAMHLIRANKDAPYEKYGYNSLYITREDRKEVSSAARKKINDILLTRVNEWFKANPESLKDGLLYEIGSLIARFSSRRNDLKDELTKVEDELTKQYIRYADVTGKQWGEQ